MKIQPSKYRFYIGEQPIDQAYISEKMALLVVFLTVFGIAVKILFF